MTPTPNPPVPPQPEPQSELAKVSVEAMDAATKWYPAENPTDTRVVPLLAKQIDASFAPLRAENARLTGELATATKAIEWQEMRLSMEDSGAELLVTRQQLAAVTEHRDQLLIPIAIPAPLKMELELCQNDLRVAKSQLAQSERELAEAKTALLNRRFDDYKWQNCVNQIELRIEHCKTFPTDELKQLIASYKAPRTVPLSDREKQDQLSAAQRDTSARAGMAEELAGDKAMLDWLEEHRRFLSPSVKDGPSDGIVIHGWIVEGEGIDHDRPTAREAIKAAMNAALPKGRL